MKETLEDTSIAATIRMYLLARGSITMTSCVHGNNADLSTAAAVSDCLGWDSFIEGRIVMHWQMVMTPFLLRRTSALLPSFWGRKFIAKLHNRVHKQWIYCNLVIHQGEGWVDPTQAAHNMSKVTDIP